MLRRRRRPHVACSDAICSALQLINFWQDVGIDFRKNRIYLPQDDMARFGASARPIARATPRGGWWDLMRFQIERAPIDDARRPRRSRPR